MFNQRFEKQMEVLWIPRLKIHCQMLRRPLIPCLRPPIGWGEICVYIYIYDSRYIHFKICLIYINFYTYTYTLRAHHQECIFHMRMRPQKRALVAAPFEHKPTDSQTNSPLPNCEETNCNGLCLGRHVARKQARGVEPIKTPCGQTPRRPRYPKLLLLKPACK